MATAKTNYPPDLVLYVIRPAVVEAKLISEKHAGDAVYVAILKEELRNIEAKIAAMEEAAHLTSTAAPVELGHDPAPENRPDANWIRAKPRELELRLRRLEQSSRQRSAELSPEPVWSDAAFTRLRQ